MIILFVKKKTKGELIRLIEKNIVFHKTYLQSYCEKISKYYDDKEEATKIRINLVEEYNKILNRFNSEIPTEMKDFFDKNICGEVTERVGVNCEY